MRLKESNDNILRFISLIPVIALFLYLIINIGCEFYLQYNFYHKRVASIKADFLKNKKEIIKSRVDFVLKTIDFHRKNFPEKEAKKEILDFVDHVRFSNGGYVFIYKLLNINGGKKFAKMIANPNRKDLIGKYISDDYKDIKGNMFRKEFLKGIRKKGESFAIYYYKKLSTGKISKKISYFKLDKKWNWVVASGIYLDKEKEVVKREKDLAKETLKDNIILYVLISIFILLIVLYVSFLLKKVLQQRFENYKKNIAQNEEELEIKNKLLIKQLYTDTLTKKSNRNALERDLKNSDFACVTIVDIDNFRWLNDLYGTKNGNTILKETASILEEFKTANDFKYNIYRIGSDEFVLLFEDINCREYIEKMINDLESFVSKYNIYLDKKNWININISIGISCEKDELLTTADMALNRAKVSHLKYVMYDESINRKEINKNIFDIKWKIEEALKNDNIIPFFQPIVDKNLNIVKYESLVRIKDGDKILIPKDFLEISKKMKLYPKISRRVIKKTFDYFRDKEIEFSINLSIMDVKNDETASFFINELKKDENFSKKVTIEILESESIDDVELFNNFIKKVRKYGVKIAIDDFGSGYSTFSNLLIIKPDIIKIDATIIKDIDKDKDKRALVKTIVIASKILDAVVIAEYVCSKSIFETLLNLKIDLFQGYYIGKPIDKIL